MKKVIGILVLICLILNVSDISFASQEDVKDFAVEFIETSLFDFVDENEIMKDSASLSVLNYINDKREIADFKQERSGRTWEFLASRVLDVKVKELENNIYDVAAEFSIDFLDGGAYSTYTPRYRVVIENVNGNYFVKGAIGDDLSSNLLGSLITTETFEFPLEYQLNSEEAPYNNEEVKNNLAEFYNEIKPANPKIYVHGKPVEIDVEPFIKNDRTMAPIRFIAENLGYEVDWENDERKVTISKDDKVLDLFIDKNYVINNGVREDIDVAPILRNERTFLPLRFIAETFDQVVIWNENDRSVHITREKDQTNDYVGKYVLINDANLEKVLENMQKPATLKIGDVGLVLEFDGDFLFVDFIRPQGDLPEDWSFARGYIPKENVILNPRQNELRMLSNVARLKDGEITLEDSVTGENNTIEGNRFENIVNVENNKLLIEMSGGANDAWVSMDDIDYDLSYFKGNPE